VSTHRPFRFGAGAFSAPSAAEWGENARRVEALGYSTLLIPDHFNSFLFAPIAALTAAAVATTTLRVGTTVFNNDFRHPAVLASEMATLDVLSDGRLEVGIGAGDNKHDYDLLGMSFDPPQVRVERMQEGVRILKGLWGEDPFEFAGVHYTVNGSDPGVSPVQRPHPPIYLGAGGKRMLAFAAREADIVGIIAQALPEGGLDMQRDTDALLAEKVRWVREAAGERFEHLELAALIWGVAITDNRLTAAERFARPGWLTPEQILASPYFLIGSVDAIVERLVELRERYHHSYFNVFPDAMETLAPVVARLAGT